MQATVLSERPAQAAAQPIPCAADMPRWNVVGTKVEREAVRSMLSAVVALEIGLARMDVARGMPREHAVRQAHAGVWRRLKSDGIANRMSAACAHDPTVDAQVLATLSRELAGAA